MSNPMQGTVPTAPPSGEHVPILDADDWVTDLRAACPWSGSGLLVHATEGE